MPPADLLEAMWAAWRRGDKAATLQYFADDVIVAKSLPREVMPFGGITVGKDAFSDRLQMVLDHYVMIYYRGRVVSADDEIARGHVEFCFRHKVTHLDLEMTMRVIVKVRDGVIVSYDQLHETERVRAYAALVADRAFELGHGHDTENPGSD